jgi:hypothetical protein
MKNVLLFLFAVGITFQSTGQTILFESTIDSVMKRTRDYRLVGANIDNYSSFYYEIGNFIPNNRDLSKKQKLDLGRSFSCGYTFKKDLAEMSSIVFGVGYYRRTQRLNSNYRTMSFEPDSAWDRAKYSSNAFNSQIRLRRYILKHGSQTNCYVEWALEGYYFFNARYLGVRKLDDLKLKRVENNPRGFNNIQYSSSLKISFSTLALGVRYFPKELFSEGKYENEYYGNWNIYLTINLPGSNRKKKKK